MNLTNTRIGLDTLTRDLLRGWDQTKTAWRDLKAQEFEDRYLAELADRVGKTSVMLEKLESLLHQVKKDCE